MAFSSIISPQTAIGTAGGQETDGAANTRPRASSVSTSLLFDIIACLGVIADLRGLSFGGVSVIGDRLLIFTSTDMTDIAASGSGGIIITR